MLGTLGDPGLCTLGNHSSPDDSGSGKTQSVIEGSPQIQAWPPNTWHSDSVPTHTPGHIEECVRACVCTRVCACVCVLVMLGQVAD